MHPFINYVCGLLDAVCSQGFIRRHLSTWIFNSKIYHYIFILLFPLIFFLIMKLPLFAVLSYLSGIEPFQKENWLNIAVWLGWSNSALNPFLYWHNRRKSTQENFQKCKAFNEKSLLLQDFILGFTRYSTITTRDVSVLINPRSTISSRYSTSLNVEWWFSFDHNFCSRKKSFIFLRNVSNSCFSCTLMRE